VKFVPEVIAEVVPVDDDVGLPDGEDRVSSLKRLVRNRTMTVDRNQGWGFSQALFDYLARFGGAVWAGGPGAGPEVVIEYVEMDPVNEIGAPLIHRITRPVTPIGELWPRRQCGAQQFAKIRRKDDPGLCLGTR